MFHLCANKVTLKKLTGEVLVSESSNIYKCRFDLSEDWDGLTTTVYFRADSVVKTADDFDGVECTIPWEVLATQGMTLEVGLRGTDGDTVVLPTIWAPLGHIHAGTSPGENVLPIVPSQAEQILREIEEAKTEAVEAAERAEEAAENVGDNLPIMAEGVLGVGTAAVKEDDMTEPVGVDDTGKLWVKPSSGGIINLEKYGITEGDVDHKAPYSAEEYAIAHNNALGIQKALNDMAGNGIGEIVLPRGTYVICYQNPTGGMWYANTGWEIVIPSYVDFDLNGSTIRVLYDSDNRNPYDLSTNELYDLNGIVFMFSQTYNSTIRNGKILGDRYERSYSNSNEKVMEQTYGVIYQKGSTNCSVVDMEISGFMGDSVAGKPSHDPDKGGNATGSTVFSNIALDDSGQEVTTGVYSHTFTSDFQDLGNIVSVGGKMMTVRTNLGYTYEFKSDDGTFETFFYDADKNFLKKAEYEQCDNIPIPHGARYCRLMIVNSEAAGNETLSMTYQITPPSSQIATVKNCKFYNNNRGGMSNLPHDIVVEGCELYENGTAGTEGWPLLPDSTRYAINCEDTICRKIIIRNNNIHDGFNCILMSAKRCLVEGNVFRNFNGVLGVYNGKDNILSNNWIEGVGSVAGFAYANRKDRHIMVTSNYLRGAGVQPNDQIVYENNVIIFDRVNVNGDNTIPQCLMTCKESVGASNKYIHGNIKGTYKDTRFEMRRPQYSTTRDYIELGEDSENVQIEYSGDAAARRYYPFAVNGARVVGGLGDVADNVMEGGNRFRISRSEIIPAYTWFEGVYTASRDTGYTFIETKIVLNEELSGTKFMNIVSNATLTDFCTVQISFENCEVDVEKSGVTELVGINLGQETPEIHISLVFRNCVFRNRTGAAVSIATIVNPAVLDETNYSVVFEGNTLEGEWTLPPNVAEEEKEEEEEAGAGIVLTNTASVGQIIEVAEVDEDGQPKKWTAVNKSVGGITLTNSAVVGQYIKVAEVDENGYPVKWTAVATPGEMRYLGRAEVAEDSAALTMTTDEAGEPLSLKRIIIRGMIKPNAAAQTGWIKVSLNGAWHSITSSVMGGMDGTDGTRKGRSFEVEADILGDRMHVSRVLASQNDTSTSHTLYSWMPITDVELNEATEINSIAMMGYQSSVIGAGSYFDAWGESV